MFTYGVISTVCVVWIHHVQIAFHVRNWTWWIFMWLVISLLGMPVACFAAQLGKYVNMKGAIYGQLLPSL